MYLGQQQPINHSFVESQRTRTISVIKHSLHVDVTNIKKCPYLRDLSRHFTKEDIQIENKQEMMEAGKK